MRKFHIISILLFIYVLLYKIYLIYYGGLWQYIINPLIWLLSSIGCYYFLYIKNKHYYPAQKEIKYKVIVSSIFYIFTFYSLGFVFDFAKSPYSLKLSGLIVNLFSILLVIGLKEFIRGILISEVDKKIYLIIIFILFFISDLNIFVIIKLLSNNNLFNLIGQYIIPPLSLNLFCTYLVKKGGYYPAILYRIITFLPLLIVPVVPKYEWIIPTLFDIMFPLLTYISINHMFNEIERYSPYPIKEQSNFKSWLFPFIITIIIIVFSLGGFGVKPSVVITKSMEPNINVGDLVIINDCDINKIKVGDIIQYKLGDYTVVHRVVKIMKGSEIKIITKGDNNNSEDRYPITSENLVGCLKYKIPYIGYPSYIVSTIFENREVLVETGK